MLFTTLKQRARVFSVSETIAHELHAIYGEILEYAALQQQRTKKAAVPSSSLDQAD